MARLITLLGRPGETLGALPERIRPAAAELAERLPAAWCVGAAAELRSPGGVVGRAKISELQTRGDPAD